MQQRVQGGISQWCCTGWLCEGFCASGLPTVLRDKPFSILVLYPFFVCRLHPPRVNSYRFKGFVSPGFVSYFPSRVSMEIERLLLWLFLVIHRAYV